MEEQIEGMSEEHFNMLLAGKEITEQIETRRGWVTIKFMDDRAKINILKRKAKILDSAPANSLSESENFIIEMIATLDELVVQGPEGWKDALSYPCSDTKAEIYRGCLFHSREIRGLQRSGHIERANSSESGRLPNNETTPDNNDNKKGQFNSKIFGQFPKKK